MLINLTLGVDTGSTYIYSVYINRGQGIKTMTSIIEKFDEAFRFEIQQKTNWHFGKPVKTRIDLNIWRKLYLHDGKNYILFDIVGAKKEESHINSTAFTVRDIDKVIAEELDECMSEFTGQTLEQVQQHFDEA